LLYSVVDDAHLYSGGYNNPLFVLDLATNVVTPHPYSLYGKKNQPFGFGILPVLGCAPCKPGHLCSGTSMTVCPSGSYCANAISQQVCDAGFFCPTGSQQPTVCPDGFHCSTAGMAFPSPCPFCDAEAIDFEGCVSGYVYNGQNIAVKSDTGMLWFNLTARTFSAMATPTCTSVVKSPVFSQNGKVMYFYDNMDRIYGFIQGLGLCEHLTSIPNIQSLQLSYEEDMLLVFATDVYFGCYSISLTTYEHTYLFFLPSNKYVDFVPALAGCWPSTPAAHSPTPH
jgi:hypothetical protein